MKSADGDGKVLIRPENRYKFFFWKSRIQYFILTSFIESKNSSSKPLSVIKLINQNETLFI
jgi:hypothetical protein